ncbi:tetratricopeptide repeat protein [Komagataeibacter xylinus]|uniref:Sel1 repeat family protein n=1 Tax=Komagataeibacter xylinus TaxID=28448 RepID=A0A857FLT2_KOMXY|nr:tetratricopeptide repeat protein [Komagataeibacter xylinus]QHC34230.1 sel1 repeat family protein [Komagataeibacter xylinus]
MNKNGQRTSDGHPLPTPQPGVVETQLMLGQIHLDQGHMDEAFTMFEAAARSGDPRAVNMLGRAHERGWGTARNPVTAALYYTHAADSGYGWALFNLADLYLAGQGVRADPGRAHVLYVAAARAGVAKALNMLGIMAEQRMVPAARPESAPVFFHAAATEGDCWGCVNLARLYLAAGQTAQAIPWLHKALEHGFGDVFAVIATLLATQPAPRLRPLAREAAGRMRAACQPDRLLTPTRSHDT